MPESYDDDPAVRIVRRLALIQKAQRMGQLNLEQVLVRQIRRLYEMLIPRLGK